MPVNKELTYLEDAERMYVHDGLETKAIEGILKKAVTRRQLDTWKKKYNWDKKRENNKKKFTNIKDSIIDLIQSNAEQSLKNPLDHKALKSLKEMILLAIKLGINIGVTEEEVTGKTKAPASERTAAALRQLLRIPEKPKNSGVK